MSTTTVKVLSATKEVASHTFKKGEVLVIQASENVNYQLIDDVTGRGPQNILAKRDGKNLVITLDQENNLDPDIIIENYYGDDNGETTNLLVGLHENGNIYAYVPESGQTADAVSMLAEEMVKPQALGGHELKAFLWAFNPWWLVGLGVLGAGIALAASGGNKGKGSTADKTAPAQPEVTANQDGSVTIKPAADADVNKTTVSYVDENGNTIISEVLKGTNGTWTTTDGNLVVDAATGVITIPANKVQDGSTVTASNTDTSGNKGADKTATTDEIDTPTVSEQPAGQDGDAAIDATPGQDNTKATVDYTDEEGNPQTITLTKQPDGTWTATDKDGNPVSTTSTTDDKTPFIDPATGKVTLPKDAVDNSKPVTVTGEKDGSTPVTKATDPTDTPTVSEQPAGQDGDAPIDATPGQDNTKAKVDYTDEDGNPQTITLTKQPDGTWTATDKDGNPVSTTPTTDDKTPFIDPTTGTVTLPKDAVDNSKPVTVTGEKDGSTPVTKATDPTDTPTVSEKPADQDGDAPIDATPGQDNTRAKVDYTDEEGNPQTITLTKQPDGTWTATDKDGNPVSTTPTTDDKTPFIDPTTGTVTLPKDAVDNSKPVKITGEKDGATPVSDKTEPQQTAKPTITSVEHKDTDNDGVDDKTTIAGTAEPNADVAIDTNGDGQPDTTVKADPQGNFTAEVPVVPQGEKVIDVTATAPNKRPSDKAEADSPAVDTTPTPATVGTVTNPAAVNEGENLVTTVTLNGTAGNPSLPFSRGGNATDADFDDVTFSDGVTKNADGTLNVPAGVTSFTITTPVKADGTTEATPETVNYTVGGVNGTEATIADTSTTPVAQPTPATVGTVTNPAAVNEGENLVTTVTLNGTAGNPSLPFSRGGNATDADFDDVTFSDGVTKNADGTLNVPAGVTSFTITTPVKADGTTEATPETVNYTVGGVPGTEATIADTSTTPVAQPTPATVGTVTNPAAVNEGENLVTTVTLNGTAGNPSLPFSRGGNTTDADFDDVTFSDGVTKNADGTLNVPAGVTSFTITTPVKADGTTEATPETVNYTVGGVNGPEATIADTSTTPATPPAAPTTAPNLTDASDTGASNSDDKTADNTPSFTIPAPAAGETPVLFVNGVEVPSTFDPNTNTITPNSPLADGPQTITTATRKGTETSEKGPELPIIVDTTPPVIQTAEVPANGDELVLTYNEALDPDNPPALDKFTVTVDGQPVTPTAVTVNGDKVTLTLPEDAVKQGQPVTVTYNDPTTNNDPAATQDVAGNDAATVTPAVTNNSTVTVPPVATPPAAPTTAPNLTDASDTGVSNSDDKTADNTPSFTIPAPQAGETPVLFVNGVEVPSTFDPATNTITPNSPLADGPQTITTATRKGTETSAQGPALPITVDTTPPSIQTAEVPANGDELVLTYNEPLDPANPPALDKFTVTVDGQPVTPTAVTVNGDKVTLTLPEDAVKQGQPVTVTYNDPTTNNDPAATQDVAGNDAPTETPAVTNNSTVTVPPVATPPAAPTTAPNLTDASDTGASNSDDKTADNTPSFTIPAPQAGETPVLFVNGVEVPSTFDPATNTITPNSPLADGPQTITTATRKGTETSEQGPELAIIVDTTPPSIQTAEVPANGDELVLTYNEPLDPANPPALDKFTVTVDGQPVTPTAVTVNGDKVTLTLPEDAVKQGQPVTVTYNDPTTNNDPAATQDVAGNDAPTETPAVTNNSTVTVPPVATPPAAPTTAPNLTDASDTGASNSDDKTADNTPSFTIPAPQAGETPVLFVNGVEVPSTFDPATNTITPNSPLADGPQTITTATRKGTETSAQGPALPITVDTTPPSIQTAEVPANGDELVLTYNEPLDPANPPALDKFTVTVDGQPVTPTAVTVNGDKVTLTLPEDAVKQGQPVTVTYNDPTTNNDPAATQDVAGNDAPTETPAVTNNSTVTVPPVATPPVAPTTAPNLTDASDTGVSNSDDKTADNTPSFTIPAPKEGETPVLFVNGTEVPSTFDPATNTITPTSPLADGPQSITTATRKGTETSEQGPELPIIVDTTPPVIQTAEVPANGDELVLTYNEPLDPANPPALDKFTVTVDGQPVTPTAVTVNGDKVTLTLPEDAVKQGQPVTVTYNDPTTNNDPAATQDVAGNDAATVTPAVTNNSTVTVPASVGTVSNPTTVNEGASLVTTVNLTSGTGNSKLPFTRGGNATDADFDDVTFSNGVTKNADGTLNVPAGVTSFTVTTPVKADGTTEATPETVNYTVGGVSGPVATIVDTSKAEPTLPPVTPVTGASATVKAVIGTNDVIFQNTVVKFDGIQDSSRTNNPARIVTQSIEDTGNSIEWGSSTGGRSNIKVSPINAATTDAGDIGIASAVASLSHTNAAIGGGSNVLTKTGLVMSTTMQINGGTPVTISNIDFGSIYAHEASGSSPDYFVFVPRKHNVTIDGKSYTLSLQDVNIPGTVQDLSKNKSDFTTLLQNNPQSPQFASDLRQSGAAVLNNGFVIASTEGATTDFNLNFKIDPVAGQQNPIPKATDPAPITGSIGGTGAWSIGTGHTGVTVEATGTNTFNVKKGSVVMGKFTGQADGSYSFDPSLEGAQAIKKGETLTANFKHGNDYDLKLQLEGMYVADANNLTNDNKLDSVYVSKTADISLSSILNTKADVIDLSGMANSLQDVTLANVKTFTQNSGSPLYISGDVGDKVVLDSVGSWTKGAVKNGSTVDGDTKVYDTWTNDGTTLYIEQGITVI